MDTVTSEAWVCFDCAHFIANGELPDDWSDEESDAWVASLPDVGTVTLGRTFSECGHTTDDDEHYEECETRTFSWSRCDSCHSTLGGARYAATFWNVP